MIEGDFSFVMRTHLSHVDVQRKRAKLLFLQLNHICHLLRARINMAMEMYYRIMKSLNASSLSLPKKTL